MPGRNRSIPLCFSSDDAVYKEAGISFLTIPTLKRDDYIEWKAELVNVLKKYRVLGPTEYQRIENGKMYICTRHFSDRDIYVTGK